VEPVLEKGSGGVFDVIVDGRLVFSKHERGRFPDEQEILDQLG
jgi:selenoprotein W-related protein